MRRPSSFLRSLPILAALVFASANSSASPGGSSHHSRGYGGHSSRYKSGGYRTPRSRHSGYTIHAGYRGIWRPGHYEAQPHQVWVPAYSHQVWRPARYETRCNASGFYFQFQISAGYYETVQVPGCYKTSSRRVWVAGYYSF